MNRRVLPFLTEADRTRAMPIVLEHLRAGGLIGYPTETVYGFGSMLLPEALERLRVLKGRPEEKPFLLLVNEPDALSGVRWTPVARRLAGAFWPGPLTLALGADGDFPPTVRGAEGTVALRSSPHPGAAALTRAVGVLTSTSANLPGDPPASSGDAVVAVLDAIGARDVLVLDAGMLPPSLPSTIIDCSASPPRLIRAGALEVEELRRIVGEIANA